MLVISSFFLSAAMTSHTGLDWSWYTWFFPLLGLAALLALLDIRVSTRLQLVVTVTGVLAVLLLAVAIVVQGGDDGLTAAPFDPSRAPSASALFLGVVLGFTAFIGFESAAVLGEEARDPLRAIPRAVISTVLIALAYYVFVTWAMAIGYGVGQRGRVGEGPRGAGHARGPLRRRLAGDGDRLRAGDRGVRRRARGDQPDLADALRDGPRRRAAERAGVDAPALAHAVDGDRRARGADAGARRGLGQSLRADHLLRPGRDDGDAARSSSPTSSSPCPACASARSTALDVVVPALGIAICAYTIYKSVVPAPPSPVDAAPYLAGGWLLLGIAASLRGSS